MMPEISVNYLAILVCIVLAMPVGFAWFGPLLGRVWAKEMDMDFEEKPDGMLKSMLLYAFSNLLIAWVLSHTIPFFMPETWGAGSNDALWVYALNGAFWNWLGFMVPLQVSRVAWEKRSFKLVLINSSFDLTRMLMFAFVITYMA